MLEFESKETAGPSLSVASSGSVIPVISKTSKSVAEAVLTDIALSALKLTTPAFKVNGPSKLFTITSPTFLKDKVPSLKFSMVSVEGPSTVKDILDCAPVASTSSRAAIPTVPPSSTPSSRAAP